MIIILSRNEDSTKYYQDAYITPVSMEDENEVEEFAEIVAEEHFSVVPDTVIEKIKIKRVGEAGALSGMIRR